MHLGMAGEGLMLRSMIIGLAIAALLQVGGRTVASTSEAALARHIDWVEVQTEALTHLIWEGCVVSPR